MCRKRRYRDFIAADLALAEVQAKDRADRPKTEKRVYLCPNCNGWHLTSRA